MIDFSGQCVVVTGAGRGMGRLYALELARRGASVVVNDTGSTMGGAGVDASVADEVVAEIEAAGGSASASCDSVATAAGGQAIVDLALAEHGRLDAVISNAGILGSHPFDELPADDWYRMVDVHLHGGFHVVQPAYRAMKERGGGRFVFISSSAGVFGQPNSAHYGAAKAGLVGLSNAIAVDGAEHGIRSNTVLPFGYSRMVWETLGESASDPEVAGFFAAIAPERVVPVVVLLASDRCPVTHHNVSAGAGRFARAFVGLGEGWLAADGEATAEDVLANWEDVSATEPHTVPSSIFDEVAELCARLGIAI